MTALSIDGTTFEYVERGEGDPVVFVHGSASDYRTWELQLDHFGKRHRAIAYSRRYHWPNEPIRDGADYSMPEHVDDLRAFLSSLNLPPSHLVGHSYGALVSLLLAMKEPQLVRTLVLAEPPAITLFVSSTPKPWEILRLMFHRPRTAIAILKFGAMGIAPATTAARRGDMTEATRIFGKAVLGHKNYRALSPTRLEQARANSIKAEFLGSGIAELEDESLLTFQTPTLLVNGHDSPRVFHRLSDRLEELLPRSKKVVIPGASHIIHEDNAPAYNEEVGSFLAKH